MPKYRSTHPLTHSLTHLLTHPLTHSPTLSLSHSLTHPLTHLLTHSPTQSLTHPLTHSLTLSLSHTASGAICAYFDPALVQVVLSFLNLHPIPVIAHFTTTRLKCIKLLTELIDSALVMIALGKYVGSSNRHKPNIYI